MKHNFDDDCSKECLDTINRYLTENRDIVVIVAGYKEALEKCFFSVNEGLTRRFPYRYHIDDYTPDELCKIFVRQVNKAGWSLDAPDTVDVDFFGKNKQHFNHNGGSCLNLLNKCQLAHARRVFIDLDLPRKRLTREDLDTGLKEHVVHSGASEENPMSLSVQNMYT